MSAPNSPAKASVHSDRPSLINTAVPVAEKVSENVEVAHAKVEVTIAEDKNIRKEEVQQVEQIQVESAAEIKTNIENSAEKNIIENQVVYQQ